MCRIEFRDNIIELQDDIFMDKILSDEIKRERMVSLTTVYLKAI